MMLCQFRKIKQHTINYYYYEILLHYVMLLLKLVGAVWRMPHDLQSLRLLTPEGNLQKF
jgi:hypothetical protein